MIRFQGLELEHELKREAEAAASSTTPGSVTEKEATVAVPEGDSPEGAPKKTKTRAKVYRARARQTGTHALATYLMHLLICLALIIR